MTEIRIDVRGLKDIDKALNRLAKETRANVLEDALEDSASPMLADYKSGAPSFIARYANIRKPEPATARRASVAIGSRHRLASIFEFGTKTRRTRGQGPVQFKPSGRGKIQRIGFARRAFDTNVNDWFRDIGGRIWRRIERVRT